MRSCLLLLSNGWPVDEWEDRFGLWPEFLGVVQQGQASRWKDVPSCQQSQHVDYDQRPDVLRLPWMGYQVSLLCFCVCFATLANKSFLVSKEKMGTSLELMALQSSPWLRTCEELNVILYHKMKPNTEANFSDTTIRSQQSSFAASQQPPPPVHQSDADEEDENVKQLGDCSSLYLSLQRSKL